MKWRPSYHDMTLSILTYIHAFWDICIAISDGSVLTEVDETSEIDKIWRQPEKLISK